MLTIIRKLLIHSYLQKRVLHNFTTIIRIDYDLSLTFYDYS